MMGKVTSVEVTQCQKFQNDDLEYGGTIKMLRELRTNVNHRKGENTK